MDDVFAEARKAVEGLRAELRDIQTNPENPRHAGFHRNDPAVSAYLDERYREVYGTRTVNISKSGIEIRR
jgi:hypothetical protein